MMMKRVLMMVLRSRVWDQKHWSLLKYYHKSGIYAVNSTVAAAPAFY